MSNQTFATPEEALAHYGVKGMRWGHKGSRPTSADIHDARDKTNEDLTRLDVKAMKVATAKGTKAKNAALKDLKTTAQKAKENDHAALAGKMTRGEKVAGGIMTVALPGVGVGWTGGYKIGLVAGRKNAQKTIDRYANAQLSDFRDLS